MGGTGQQGMNPQAMLSGLMSMGDPQTTTGALLGKTAAGMKPPGAAPTAPKGPAGSAISVQSGPELQQQFSIDPAGVGGGTGIDPRTLEMLQSLMARGRG
jgi:hypothetical protein